MAKATKRIGAKKLTQAQAETDKQAAEIVHALLEKQKIDAMLHHSFHDKAGLTAELESIIFDLERASERATALYGHFQMGRLDPFSAIQGRVVSCREAALNAWVQARCAQQELAIEHQQHTRSLYLQRSAVRLAVAYFKPTERGRARALAKKVMQKAGLPDPDESTVTKWIKEFRNQ